MTTVGDRRRERVETDRDEERWPPAVPAWRPWAAFVLSVLGFGVSMYLTIDHFTGILPVCSSSGFVNCTLVTTSKYSYLFHVPVALLGLIFFTLLVAVNVPRLWRVSAPWLAWVRLLLVIGGMVDVLYLLSRELFSLKAICLWCTSVHVLTFLLFVLVVMSTPAMTGRADTWEEWDDEPGDDEPERGDVALGPA